MQRTYAIDKNVKLDKNSKSNKDVKYEKITQKIEDILFSQENEDIQNNKDFSLEISKIFYKKNKSHEMTDMTDITDIDQQIKNENLKIKTSVDPKFMPSYFKNKNDNDITSYGEFKLQMLNGINRLQSINKNKDSHSEYIYEERGYAIYYDSDFWLVTIKVKCSQNSIPMVVDYDQSYDFYQKKYSSGLREIGILNENLKDVVNYDICDVLSQKQILELERDLFTNKCVSIVRTIDEKYDKIFG